MAVKTIEIFGNKLAIEETKLKTFLYGTSGFLIIFNLVSLPFVLPKYKKFIGAQYLPTNQEAVDAIFRVLSLSRVQPTTMLDLGSGDGRIVIAAAKNGYRKAIGYEINPWLYCLSQYNAIRYLTPDQRSRVDFRLGNIWDAKKDFFENIDAITVYGRPGDQVMEKIGKKLYTETRDDVLVVSNTFDLPGEWESKLVKELDGIKLYDKSIR